MLIVNFAFYIITILSLLAGCAVPKAKVYEKDGEHYGVVPGIFTSQWYDYYERGLSYAEGDYWEDALKDFTEAARLRDKDQRRARTYGLHFIDYFSHRELGVCYYHLGRLEKAIEELERSLKDVDTAKAKYYLKKAREAWLKKTQKDQLNPRISLLKPEKGFLTNEFSTHISGLAQDDYFISDIRIDGEAIWIELPEKTVPFEKTMALDEGMNNFQILARDLSGKEVVDNIEILADRKGPMVGMAVTPLPQNVSTMKFGLLKSEIRNPKSQILVKGYVYDRTGVERLSINGVKIKLEEGKGAEFSHIVDLASALGSIRYEAIDKVGNVTRGEFTPKIVSSFKFRVLSYNSGNVIIENPISKIPPLFASLESTIENLSDGNIRYPMSMTLKSLPFHLNPFTLDLRPLTFNIAEGSIPETFSPDPIRIKLKDLTDYQTVYYDRELVEVEVSSLYEIKDVGVKVNGRPQIIGEEDSYISHLLKFLKGLAPQKFSFSQRVELKEGENEIIVEVEDLQGNSVKEKITINRKINRLKEISSRMSLLIYPAINSSGEIPVMKQGMLNSYLRSFLVNLGRFNILVEKEKRDEILHEQKLSQGYSMDKDTAVELGRTKAAELVLFGEIFEDKRSITLKCSVADVETTEIMADVDMFSEDKENVKILTEGLALKIARHFPMLEGLVIDRKEDMELVVDIGLKDSMYLKRNMKYILYKESAEIKHPVTGKILGKEIEVKGFARVEQVMDEYSLAKYLGKDGAHGIAREDKVITK